MAEAVAEATLSPVGSRAREAAIGWSAALLSAATFGTSGAFAKPLLASGWSAGGVVAIRLGLAAMVLMVPGLIALRGRWRLLLDHWRPLLAYGVFGGATAQVSFFNSVQYVPVAWRSCWNTSASCWWWHGWRCAAVACRGGSR